MEYIFELFTGGGGLEMQEVASAVCSNLVGFKMLFLAFVH